MNVAFRVDASSQIGTGHLMRCLALAEALKQRGAQVIFVCRNLPEYLPDMVRAKGVALAPLDGMASPQVLDDLLHAHWLGRSQQQDAEETVRALSGQAWDWLIVDHYALDARWEAALRGTAKRIMVIDDIADRQHDSDVLVDQNFHMDMQVRYIGKVPDNCQLLLGPRYALLREEFRQAREQVKLRRGLVRRVLVCFGGVDANNYTARAIEAIASIGMNYLQVDVVIGPQHPFCEQIESACAEYGFLCHVQSNRMAELTAAADVAIGAGGGTSWERCFLGVPTICVATAFNQVSIIEGLQSRGAIVKMESGAAVSADDFSRALLALIGQPEQLMSLSAAASELVDGEGARRVCEWILTPHEAIRTVH